LSASRILPGKQRNRPKEFSMKTIAFSLIASALLAHSALAQDKVVNVYNWTDYVDPTVLEDFTKATGIKVVYDTYDNNEIVETKLLAGKSGYDIVVPSGPFLQRLITQKIFLPIDRNKVPEIKNAWPESEKTPPRSADGERPFGMRLGRTLDQEVADHANMIVVGVRFRPHNNRSAINRPIVEVKHG